MESNCQSDFLHDPRDLNSHYFGCLRSAEQEAFLDRLPARSQAHIREEESRITQLRLIIENRHHTDEGLLLRRHKQSLHRWRKISKAGQDAASRLRPPAPAAENTFIEDVDIYASMIFFKDSRPHTLPEFLPEEFPDQKIPLKRLLYDEDPTRNPLTRDCPEGMIRYFHVPANDMKWVEELMACYYGDPSPFDLGRRDFIDDDGIGRTKTQTLLDHEVWRGQQRGPSVNDPVHARSMRPRCDLIPTADRPERQRPTKNLVLYMPYLHWETYRARAEQARTIKSCDQGKRSISQKFSDIAQMTLNKMNSKKEGKKHRRRLWPTKSSKYESHVLDDIVNSWKPRVCLGQLFKHAAALAMAMNFYRDKTLLEQRLDLIPPLHPRRTLDQYYYWALKDIETQDKSQVVYRATAPTDHLPDQFAERDLDCRECLQDIRTVPRLLMVDQLWLWILDASTVITFFPARWGRNEDDNSDVHRRLRLRLKAIYQQEIHSAYDLAIVIIDQCSQVFFDRTAIRSLRPQVLEIFAHAIGDVSFKQITSFNHFLEYTRMFSVAYKARSEKRSVVRHQSMIDITMEVKLLQEIKDILDELMIMTNVLREQLSVSKTFSRHVQNLLRASAEQAEERDRAQAPHLKFEGLPRTRMAHTMSRADDLLKSIEERIAELQRLMDTATDVASALNDLLGLKQQQMGVVEARLEAREAVEQGRETVRQGRTIMLFTVVTIIFMPLSFVASVFGMNVAEFNGGNLTIHKEFAYMFPISLGFSLVTLAIAFKIYTIP